MVVRSRPRARAGKRGRGRGQRGAGRARVLSSRREGERVGKSGRKEDRGRDPPRPGDGAGQRGREREEAAGERSDREMGEGAGERRRGERVRGKREGGEKGRGRDRARGCGRGWRRARRRSRRKVSATFCPLVACAAVIRVIFHLRFLCSHLLKPLVCFVRGSGLNGRPFVPHECLRGLPVSFGWLVCFLFAVLDFKSLLQLFGFLSLKEASRISPQE